MKKTAMASVGMLILAMAGWLALGHDLDTHRPDEANATASQPAAAHPAPTSGPAIPPGPAERTAPDVATPSGVDALPVTGEADTYAAAVATVVFGMDTRTHDPADYRRSLLDAADPHLSPTGYADLERLLAERIPTTEQWARMRANDQWSGFEPTEVWEPGSWAQVVIAGQAEPGWVVRNVTGVQTTHYTDTGAEKTAVRERSVTVAMRCPAPRAGVDSCRLVLVGGSVLP